MRQKFYGLFCACFLLWAGNLPAEPFAEDFSGKGPGTMPEKWTIWQPSGDSGKVTWNEKTGHLAPGAAEFTGCQRTVLQYKAQVLPGKWYCLSAYAKTDVPGLAAGEVTITPEIRKDGKDLRAISGTASGRQVRLTQDWQRLEVWLEMPGEQALDGAVLSSATLGCYARNAPHHLFYDEIRLQEVTPDFLYYETFPDADALENFEIYARGGGIEGVAELAHRNSGYGAPGSLAVVYQSGKCGYGATLKKPIPVKQLGKPGEAFTLSVRISAEAAGAIAGIGLEQLDQAGRVTALQTMEVKNPVPGQFQCAELSFYLDKDAVAVRPVLSSNAETTLLFDDLLLRKAAAGEIELLAREHVEPIWCTLYPADFYAWIDGKPSMLAITAGEVNGFYIQLAGDKTISGDTVLDVELPDVITLLTAEGGTWSEAPSPWQEEKAARKNCRRYRFVNPIDWQKLMVSGNPNPYTGLLLAVKTDADAGSLEPMTIRLSVGGKTGETRTVPIQVFPKPEPVPELKDFFIGIWDLNAIYLHDENVRNALIAAYQASGVRGGSFNLRRPQLSKTLPADYAPMIIIHGPDTASVYQGLYSKPIPPMMRPDGSPASGHIALGMALHDQELQEAYRKYLQKVTAIFPENAPKFAVIDIEFWSDGVVTKSCFHPSTIEEFRKFAKLGNNVKLDGKIILEQYAKLWSDFRNDVTARLHKFVRDELHALDPEIKLLAYDYTLDLDGTPQNFVDNAPMNTLLYDQAVDVHDISYYNYEGVNFLDHVDCDVRHLARPVFIVPYISEALATAQLPNWNYHHPSAAELTRELLGAASSGAKGFHPFTGKLLDAERLAAIHAGAMAIAKYQDYYRQGKRVDDSVVLQGMGELQRYRCHELHGKKLLTIFNCDNREVTIQGPPGTIQLPADGFVQIEY